MNQKRILIIIISTLFLIGIVYYITINIEIIMKIIMIVITILVIFSLILLGYSIKEAQDWEKYVLDKTGINWNKIKNLSWKEKSKKFRLLEDYTEYISDTKEKQWYSTQLTNRINRNR